MQLDAHTWQLIGSVVRGEANEEEEAAFRDWLSRSPDHEKLFQEAKQAWEESRALQSALEFDAQSAKARVRARLANASQQAEPVLQPVRPSSRQVLISWEFWAKMAAVVTFIGLSAWLARTLQGWEVEDTTQTVAILEKATESGQRMMLTLEDGTQVKLNSNSKLSYPEHFDSQLREVTLVGEAFFEVAPDASRPFIVRTGAVETKVLGTAFNVLFDSARGDTEVAVAEGKVAVMTPDRVGNSLQTILLPVEALTYSAAKGLSTKHSFDMDEVLGWKDGKLVFKNASFQLVRQRIEDWYGVEIRMAYTGSLERGFSATYQRQTLEQVMEGIAFSYGFNYQIEGKIVRIY